MKPNSFKQVMYHQTPPLPSHVCLDLFKVPTTVWRGNQFNKTLGILGVIWRFFLGGDFAKKIISLEHSLFWWKKHLFPQKNRFVPRCLWIWTSGPRHSEVSPNKTVKLSLSQENQSRFKSKMWCFAQEMHHFSLKFIFFRTKTDQVYRKHRFFRVKTRRRFANRPSERFLDLSEVWARRWWTPLCMPLLVGTSTLTTARLTNKSPAVDTWPTRHDQVTTTS